jgi:cytochrome c-type protein NapB
MTVTPVQPPARPRGKGAVVAGLVALTVALSGFFMGLRQTSDEADSARPTREKPPVVRALVPPPADPDAKVPPALEYARLRERTLQPNHGWKNRLADLNREAPARFEFARLTADEQEMVRHQRASRRQYDGAPPVAPHPLNQTTAAACLECHGQPVVIAGITVPQMSHQPYENCLQCHVSALGPTSTWRSRPISLADGNAFRGKGSPGYGARAYEGAPPVMPHATWMRQSCLSCHGPGGANSFSTPHPDRHNCLQCHAPDATLDQTPSLARSDRPPPLPAR